jgi:hypothetical protein
MTEESELDKNIGCVMSLIDGAPEAVEAFDAVLKELRRAPLVAYPTEGHPMALQVFDRENKWVGVAILQEDPDAGETGDG